MRHIIVTLFLCCYSLVFSQSQEIPLTEPAIETEPNEDFEQYGNVEFADGNAKEFANAKINGLSPARFIYLSWDVQTPYKMEVSPIGSYEPNENNWTVAESAKVNYTGGVRFNANIPIISRNNILWQMGLNYMETAFNMTSPNTFNGGLINELQNHSLKSAGIFTTLYKPINAKYFFLFQGQMDYNGNYHLNSFQDLSLTKYAWAGLFGKRPHDRLQWGIGISRTYRVGELNYIPIVLYNWTSVKRKWGCEILFPAKAHGRYNFSPNSLLLFGYELEGNSYHLSGLSNFGNSYELRRGEIRPRLEWQKKLAGFIWGNVQVGSRLNYNFFADELPNGNEFFRGFFGNQNVSTFSSLSTSAYFLVGISFVSP